MTSSIEWITESIGRLRVWEHDNAKYGEPYYLHAIVFLIGERTIEIGGIDKPIRRRHWREIIKMCKRDGFRRILSKRFRQGTEQEHWIEVNK